MAIVLNKVLPEQIVNQIMMYNDIKFKDNWNDFTIKQIRLEFVSTKPDFLGYPAHYFKIRDDIVDYDKFKTFVQKVNTSPIWQTGGETYMINIGDTDNYKLFAKSGLFTGDLTFVRYSDYRCGGGKGICYKVKLRNIQSVFVKEAYVKQAYVKKQVVNDDPFADFD